jgi:hypothetical protein
LVDNKEVGLKRKTFEILAERVVLFSKNLKLGMNQKGEEGMIARSSLKRRVFVLGGTHVPYIGKGHPDFVWKGHPEFGKRENPTIEHYITESVKGAIEQTGGMRYFSDSADTQSVHPSLIERGWIGNFGGELYSKQGHLGSAVVGSIPTGELKYKPFTRVEAACASGGLAFAAAVDAIQVNMKTVAVR